MHSDLLNYNSSSSMRTTTLTSLVIISDIWQLGGGRRNVIAETQENHVQWNF
jgi:hypothetical protein